MTNQTTNKTNTTSENETMKEFSFKMVSFQNRRENADKAQAKFFKDNLATALSFQDYVKAKNELCLKKDDDGNFKLSKNGKPLIDNKKLAEMLTETPFGNATWILERAFRNEKSVILKTTVEQTRENMANNPDSNVTGWHGLEQAEKKRIAKLARELKKGGIELVDIQDDASEKDDDDEKTPLEIRKVIGKLTANRNYGGYNTKDIDDALAIILLALLEDNKATVNETQYKAYRRDIKKAS